MFIHTQRGGRSTRAGHSRDIGDVLGDQNRFWRIEPEEGFSLEDLLGELGTLEEAALGIKVHER
jgi:hypothetical protein